MWIKTQNGEYYNADFLEKMFLDSSNYTCFRFSGGYLSVPGDIRETVMECILSRVDIMEVEV